MNQEMKDGQVDSALSFHGMMAAHLSGICGLSHSRSCTVFLYHLLCNDMDTNTKTSMCIHDITEVPLPENPWIDFDIEYMYLMLQTL